jgi:hypothetical protein
MSNGDRLELVIDPSPSVRLSTSTRARLPAIRRRGRSPCTAIEGLVSGIDLHRPAEVVCGKFGGADLQRRSWRRWRTGIVCARSPSTCACRTPLSPKPSTGCSSASAAPLGPQNDENAPPDIRCGAPLSVSSVTRPRLAARYAARRRARVLPSRPASGMRKSRSHPGRRRRASSRADRTPRMGVARTTNKST